MKALPVGVVIELAIHLTLLAEVLAKLRVWLEQVIGLDGTARAWLLDVLGCNTTTQASPLHLLVGINHTMHQEKAFAKQQGAFTSFHQLSPSPSLSSFAKRSEFSLGAQLMRAEVSLPTISFSGMQFSWD
jgi:hypothetical protein